jgi:hypothetical protein
VLPSRAQLDAFLGSSAVTADFETYSIQPDKFVGIGAPLDSQRIVNGQGPGLVPPGVAIAERTELQWYGTTVFGGNSKRLGFSSGSPYTITFNPPIVAFGVDLLSLPNHGDTVNIEVYSGPGRIGSFDSPLVDDPQRPTFVGFRSPSFLKISSVFISTFEGGPILDNLTFGRVPEPTTAMITAVGVAMLHSLRRRRKCI